MAGPKRAQATEIRIPTRGSYPAPQITAPIGGERLPIGSTYTIRWSGTDDGLANIYYTVGVTWTLIATVDNTGSYSWTVNAPASESAQVRVVTQGGSSETNVIFIGVEQPSETTLTSLIATVNRKLASYLGHHRQTETLDGLSSVYMLRNQNIITLSVDGATVEASSTDENGDPTTVDVDVECDLDQESGMVTFSSVPDSGTATFDYTYRFWSEEHVIEAINSAIMELFGVFHVTGSSTFTTTGEQEYLLSDGNGVALSTDCHIKTVELYSVDHWVKLEDWRIVTLGSEKYLHFVNVPITGYTIRFVWQGPPRTLSLPSETLEGSSGLPTRAKEPIVLLACSELILDRLPPRVRDDRAHNTQGENVVKSYEVVNASNAYRARAELKMSRMRMDPLSVRIVL